jgi:hypothetical protein
MHSVQRPVTAAILLAGATFAFAIDRDAATIERIQLDGTAYSDSESLTATLISENVVDRVNGRWAILIAAAFGNHSPDGEGDNEMWSAGLGLKFYATAMTSLTLMGTYSSIETLGGDTAVWGGELTLRQRLLDCTAPVSPYVEWHTACLEISEPAGGATRQSFVALVAAARLGLEFTMNDELSFIAEGGFSGSQNIDAGRTYANGWIGTIGVQYYWY